MISETSAFPVHKLFDDARLYSSPMFLLYSEYTGTAGSSLGS